MVYVPEEILIHIMTRLCDGRSIVRFRCVNKLCCRLLSDPNFIHRFLCSGDGHKNEEEEKKQPTHILIKRHARTFGRRDCRFWLIYSILSYDTVPRELRPVIKNNDQKDGKDYEDGLVDLEYLALPVVRKKYRALRTNDWRRFYIVGCCNGIFCIADEICDEAADIIFWNPSTSEFKVLPNSSNRPKLRQQQLGFGFDSKTQDYKVVRTLIFYPSFTSLTEVYSLMNDSWRKHDYTRNHERDEHDLPADSVVQSHESKCERVYWYNSCGKGYKRIASFDMRTEKFADHTYPTSLRRIIEGRLSDSMKLVAMPRESTMVAVFGDYQHVYQIWGLLDFQIPESWIKLFTISQFARPDVDCALGPLGKSGNYLFLKREGDLFAFNPGTEEIIKVPSIQAIAERSSSHELDLQVATYNYLPSQTSITSLAQTSSV